MRNRKPDLFVNANGTVVERYTYDAFGKRNVFDGFFTAKANTDYNWNRTFTGQVLDMETMLMLYRMRYYNTLIGIWTSRDPIGYSGEDINLYRYVRNQSILLTDLYGLKQCGPRVWVYTGSWCVADNVWDAAMDVAGDAFTKGAAATADGVIPFWDPFEFYYLDACGNIPPIYQWSRNIAAGSRDIALIAIIPNLSIWAKNPVTYEIGQITVPNATWKTIQNLSVPEKAQWINAHGGLWHNMRSFKAMMNILYPSHLKHWFLKR